MADNEENKAKEEKKKKESELEKKTKKEHDKLSEKQKKDAAENKKIEEKKQEEISDKVKESKGFFAKALDLGYHAAVAVGATALGLATAGTAAPIVAATFAGSTLIGSFFSKKEKPSLYERVTSALSTYSVVNAILSPIILLGDVTFPLISKGATLLGKAARALYAVTLYNAAFLTVYKAGDHLVKNKFDTTGIGKSVKDNWMPMYKRFAIGFAPGYALGANGIATIAGFPTFAYNAIALGAYNGINPPGAKKEEKQTQTPKPDYKPSPA